MICFVSKHIASNQGANTVRINAIGWIRIVTLIVVFALIIAFLVVSEAPGEAVLSIMRRGTEVEPCPQCIYVIVYAVAAVLLIPGSILTLAAGFFYGAFAGALLATTGATIGATVAMLIARFILGEPIRRKLRGKKILKRLDALSGRRDDWVLVLLLRLSPLFPFNLLNYAFGLTKVRVTRYIAASWVGMLPGAFMYAYFGSLLGTFADAATGAEQAPRSPLKWGLYVLGFMATAAVVVFVSKRARRTVEEEKEDR